MRPTIKINKSSLRPLAIGDWVLVRSYDEWSLHVVAQTQPGMVQLIYVSNTDANRNERHGPVRYDNYDDIGREATESLMGDRTWKHVNVDINVNM